MSTKTRFKIDKSYRPKSYDGNPMNPGALTVEAGKMMAEAFNKRGQGQLLKEKFGITFKEDVTTSTAAGSFTTLLSSTLYTAAISNIKEILDLVFINEDMMGGNGFGAYKIPRLQPTTAVVVSEGAVVNYFDEGADSITVTPVKIIAGTAITWEIMKRGMTDFARFVLQNAADSIARKLASDIVNGLAAGADTTTSGGISYAKINTAEGTVASATDANGVPLGFLPDKLVIATGTWASFLADADVKQLLYRIGAKPGDPTSITLGPGKLVYGNMEIVRTPFLTSAVALILDSRKAAILVKESDLETFEGSIPGRPYDREVVALMSYVLAVIYPKAVLALTA